MPPILLLPILLPLCGLAPQPLRRVLTLALATGAVVAAAPAQAATPASASAHPPASAPGWPAAVTQALARAQVPASSLGVWLQPLDAAEPRLAWQARRPMNPASVGKLLTAAVALDQLGPAWRWQTPVGWTAPPQGGQLPGDLVIQGRGDPSLVLERVWLLLQRVQAAGIRDIRGDIVLDSSAFRPAPADPAQFDGEPWRPYNVQPDALLLNYKAVTLGFTPDAAGHRARVSVEPALAGVGADASVPLSAGPCDDWRGGLKLDTTDPARWHAAGSYPAACGERSWPLAYADPASYAARLVEALWRGMGGQLQGRLRAGTPPAGWTPAFQLASPPLAEVLRDMLKYSNNVMAEQLALTLARERAGREAAKAAGPGPGKDKDKDTGKDVPRELPPVGGEDARRVLDEWLRARVPGLGDETRVVNGSGLSRDTRLMPQTLGQLLLDQLRGPWSAELVSALPVSGLDGTLQRSGAPAQRAHLKTGSLREVQALAGEVLSASGRRWALVVIVNDPRAAAARPALDALVAWVVDDAPAGR